MFSKYVIRENATQSKKSHHPRRNRGVTACMCLAILSFASCYGLNQTSESNNWSIENFITGERVVSLCDVAYFSEAYLAEFGAMRKYASSVITVESAHMAPATIHRKVNESFIFFLKLDWVEQFKRDVLPLIHKPFILVSHNSDHLAGADLELLNNPLLKAWYGQNMLPHEKTKGVPIGLENVLWGRTDFEHIRKCRRNMKTNLLYFQFSDYSNSARPGIRSSLRKNGFQENKETDWQSYISELSTHKFCVAPPGNGIDTHRAWECIYLGVVPIILRSNVMLSWFQQATILWVESYEEITHDRLMEFVMPEESIPEVSKLNKLHQELSRQRALLDGQ